MLAPSTSRAPVTSLYESRDYSEGSSVSFARRPGYGSIGKIISLGTNSCRIEIDDEAVGRPVYRYSTEIRLMDQVFNNEKIVRRLFWEILEANKKDFPPYQVVFDDREAIYSLKKIEKNYFEKKYGPNNQYTMSLTLDRCVRFDLDKICSELQCSFLNALLTQAERCELSSFKEVSRFFVVRDKMFMIPKEGMQVCSNWLGKGLEMWYALHSLVNISEQCEAIVNYDRKCGVFLKMKMPILDYYLCYVGGRPRPNPEDYEYFKRVTMNPAQRRVLKENLKGLSLSTVYGTKRHYKFYDVAPEGARNSFFEYEDRETGEKTRISVEDYYIHKLGIRLSLPHFPLIQVSPPAKKIFIPMEVLTISDKPQRFPKPLPEECMREALKKNVATINPRDRFDFIMRLMRDVNVNEKSKFMQKFGVQVNQRLINVEGRVLPLPTLCIKEGSETFQPDKSAAWPNIAVQSNGTTQTVISVIVDAEIHAKMGPRFVQHFNVVMDACRSIGVQLVDRGYYEPTCEVFDKNRQEMREVVHRLYNRVGVEYGRDVDFNHTNFLIFYVACEKNDSNYSDLKAVCELELKVFSQVVLEKTFRLLMDTRKSPARNIALKINTKLGGVTTAVVPRQELWAKFTSSVDPTLFIGVDAAYTRKEGEISLFAVSGSVNLDGTRYQTTITPMASIPGYADQAIDLTVPIQVSLKAFYKGTGGLYPAHIVIYRLGITSSQRKNAANNELKAIWAAVKEMAEHAPVGAFDPTVTYISIEKNHQNRFRYEDQGGRLMPNGYASGNQGNVPAGTVVEKVVTSSTLFDFFLCSHHGALGTSRPTHYVVFYDDWELSPDDIHSVTFCLCFLTSNCTRSISLPAPAYYASKGCERGKKYINSCILNENNENPYFPQPYEALPVPKAISTTMYII